MSDLQGTEIISRYKETFNQTYKQTPKTMIAVSVICAETTKEAKKIARSTALWTSFNEKPVYSQIPSYEEAERFKGTQEQEARSEEHTSELQSRFDLVCRLLLEKKKNQKNKRT